MPKTLTQEIRAETSGVRNYLSLPKTLEFEARLQTLTLQLPV